MEKTGRLTVWRRETTHLPHNTVPPPPMFTSIPLLAMPYTSFTLFINHPHVLRRQEDVRRLTASETASLRHELDLHQAELRALRQREAEMNRELEKRRLEEKVCVCVLGVHVWEGTVGGRLRLYGPIICFIIYSQFWLDLVSYIWQDRSVLNLDSFYLRRTIRPPLLHPACRDREGRPRAAVWARGASLEAGRAGEEAAGGEAAGEPEPHARRYDHPTEEGVCRVSSSRSGVEGAVRCGGLPWVEFIMVWGGVYPGVVYMM